MAVEDVLIATVVLDGLRGCQLHHQPVMLVYPVVTNSFSAKIAQVTLGIVAALAGHWYADVASIIPGERRHTIVVIGGCMATEVVL